ncbi:MAG: phage tail tape measure protein [Nitrospiraceae bacterium]
MRIDPSGAKRGGRQVEKSLNRVSTAADRTRKVLARAFAFSVIAIALRSTIGLLANFEQQMSTVRAISGATEAQFKSLTEEAKRLGITTRFSASEAAEGMVFLARAGFEVNEVLGSIQGTLLLAQAGALGLGEAADIASNVLKGFRLEVSETGRVVDVLALAANSANTTVGQLGQGLKFVAPIAAGLGVSLEETTAAMSALSDAGLQSTLAGTGLRRILSELESPAKKTRDILASVGLTEADVRVSTVGLTKALTNLRDAGVDTGQALELFGDRGGPAFEVLSSSLPDVVRMTEELGNAGGTAERIARIMDDNLNGALLSVRSAFQGLILELGEAGATGALRSFFDALAAGLRTLAANVDTIIKVLNVLVIVLGVKLAQVALPAAIAAVKAFTAAILANPIGLLITGLIVVTAALISFADEVTVSSDGLVTLGDLATATFETLGPTIASVTAFLAENFSTLTAVFGDLFKDVEFSIEGILRVTARVVDGMVGFFVGTADAIEIAFENIPAALEAVFVKAFNLIIKAFIDWSNFIRKGINVLLEAAGLAPIGMLDSFTIGLSDAATNIGERMDQAIADGIKNQNAAGNALDAILLRARVIAGERREEEAAGDDSSQKGFGEIDLGATSLGVPAGGAPSPIKTVVDKDAAAFRTALEDLGKQNELLRVNSREREILSGIIAIETDLKRELTDVERAEATALLQLNQAFQTQAALLDDIQGPQENYKDNVDALHALLARGAITQDQFNEKFRDLRLLMLDSQTDIFSGFERGLLRVEKSMGDFASTSEQLVVDAFDEAGKAIENFVLTGKLSFEDLAKSVILNLVKIAAQKVLTSIAGSGGGGGGFGGGGAAGGIGGLIGNLFADKIQGTQTQGFAHGGSFTVGAGTSIGSPLAGVDNRLIAFRAKDGEDVSITPKGQSGGGRPVVVNFHFPPGTDETSFRRSQGQIAARTSSMLQRANQRNN